LIENTCKTSQNLVPVIVDAVLEYATLGEIVTSMKNYFGEWTENSII
jgi:methylmalonyl-CoA mutase N-terminal domain/subunit